MINLSRVRAFTARRLILLGTAANLGLAAVAVGIVPSFVPALSTADAAEGAQRAASFADLVEKVKPAVISVRVNVGAGARTASADRDMPFPPNSEMERFFRRFGMPDMKMNPDNRRESNPRPMTGQGSGFFISADGYAVTNHHVVDNAQTVEIVMDDGKTYNAKVVGTDPRTDIALLKVDGRDNFPHVTLSDKAPRVGDWVVAIGNPFGLGGTVTAGIVSARGRDIGAGPYDDFIQIDASVNKGNSGGPTFDMDGNVIGVNTAIYSPSGGSVGIAFDVPADIVKSVVAQLKDKGVVTRGWIGVQVQPVTADLAEGLGQKQATGALVVEPQVSSPAAKAGIMSGDVITAVDGTAIKDARDLTRHIGSMVPGTTARLTIWRKGEEKSISLTLGELPKNREASVKTPNSGSVQGDVPRLGLTLAPVGKTAGGGVDGLVVNNIDPNGPAAESGIKTGDVILDVGGKKVTAPADVRDGVSDAQKAGKRSVLIRVKSNDVTKFVAISIARA